MTRLEFNEVIEEQAMESIGTVSGIEFVVCQPGPFELSNGDVIQKRFMVYLPDEDNPTPMFYDTTDELLDSYVINGTPLCELLERITEFSVSTCKD